MRTLFKNRFSATGYLQTRQKDIQKLWYRLTERDIQVSRYARL